MPAGRRRSARRSRRCGTTVRREPVRVIAAVIPWNAPHQSALAKIVPALLAGCTVVLKAAPETALDALVLGEIFAEAGLPEGVLSILPAGREVSEYLVSHPSVDKIAFTGSTAAGRRNRGDSGRTAQAGELGAGRQVRRDHPRRRRPCCRCRGAEDGVSGEQRRELRRPHPHPCAPQPLRGDRCRAGNDDRGLTVGTHPTPPPSSVPWSAPISSSACGTTSTSGSRRVRVSS